MRKKDILRTLRHLDEDTAVQLARKHPGLTDADRTRILARLESGLAAPEAPEEKPAITVSRMHYAATVAACLLVCCGALAGGFALSRMRPPEQIDTTNAVPMDSPVHAVGETYRLGNAGTAVTMTVDSAGHADGICYAQITLSADAPAIFLADNLMAATEGSGGIWNAVQPCSIAIPEGSLVSRTGIALNPGEPVTIEVQYRLDAESWMLVTSYQTGLPYTQAE